MRLNPLDSQITVRSIYIAATREDVIDIDESSSLRLLQSLIEEEFFEQSEQCF